MILSDFENKYIVHIPQTLYSKTTKLDRMLSMIEDEHAKESVIIVVDVNCLYEKKTTLRKLKKNGYKFALAVTEEAQFDSKYYTTMAITDYIFVDKNMPNIIKIAANLPEDIADKLVYENIIDKIGDFGGEEE